MDMPIPKGTHVKLNKEQRETAEGLELIHLLQSITQDGKFTAEEIKELTKWLRRNKESPLPAISFLTETVDAVIADGKVTRDEQETLYKAVERVLPKELTALAKENRTAIRERNKEIAEAEKAEAREQREQERAKAKAERHLNKKIGHYNFMVAGTRYDGRPKRIRAHAEEGLEIVVVREPTNRHSRNACRLFIADGMVEIGYVPERDNWGENPAASLSQELDSGCKYQATIYKMLTGGYSPIPVVVVETFDKDATLAGLRVPTGVAGRRAGGQGCVGGLALMLMLAALVAEVLSIAVSK